MPPNHSQQGGREEGYKSYLLANNFSSLVCNQAILSREGERKMINLTSLRKVIKLTSLPTRSPALYAASHSQQGGREEGYKSYLFADKFSSLVCNQAILSREGERKTISLTSLPTSSPALYATNPFQQGGKENVINLTSLPTSSPALYATKPFSAGRERGKL